MVDLFRRYPCAACLFSSLLMLTRRRKLEHCLQELGERMADCAQAGAYKDAATLQGKIERLQDLRKRSLGPQEEALGPSARVSRIQNAGIPLGTSGPSVKIQTLCCP